MSFAEQVRLELSTIAIKKPCCRRALVAGLLLGAERESGKELSLRLGSAAMAEASSEWIRGQFGKTPSVTVTGACGHRYWDLSFLSPAAAKLAQSLQESVAEDVLRLSCEQCGGSFLRGVFLGYGTVNDPHKSFHLEFLMPQGRGAALLERFLEGMGYPPRAITRKKGTGLYYKDGGVVEELVTLMGAHHNVFEIINSRIERDIRNNENRATNCVAKNIEKSISAATRQMDAINRLMETGKLEQLPEGLRNTALLRYRNPDATLDELTALHQPSISKSGLNHRLQRILDEAEDL